MNDGDRSVVSLIVDLATSQVGSLVLFITVATIVFIWFRIGRALIRFKTRRSIRSSSEAKKNSVIVLVARCQKRGISFANSILETEGLRAKAIARISQSARTILPMETFDVYDYPVAFSWRGYSSAFPEHPPKRLLKKCQTLLRKTNSHVIVSMLSSRDNVHDIAIVGKKGEGLPIRQISLDATADRIAAIGDDLVDAISFCAANVSKNEQTPEASGWSSSARYSYMRTLAGLVLDAGEFDIGAATKKSLSLGYESVGDEILARDFFPSRAACNALISIKEKIDKNSSANNRFKLKISLYLLYKELDDQSSGGELDASLATKISDLEGELLNWVDLKADERDLCLAYLRWGTVSEHDLKRRVEEFRFRSDAIGKFIFAGSLMSLINSNPSQHWELWVDAVDSYVESAELLWKSESESRLLGTCFARIGNNAAKAFSVENDLEFLKRLIARVKNIPVNGEYAGYDKDHCLFRLRSELAVKGSERGVDIDTKSYHDEQLTLVKSMLGRVAETDYVEKQQTTTSLYAFLLSAKASESTNGRALLQEAIDLFSHEFATDPSVYFGNLISVYENRIKWDSDDSNEHGEKSEQDRLAAMRDDFQAASIYFYGVLEETCAYFHEVPNRARHCGYMAGMASSLGKSTHDWFDDTESAISFLAISVTMHRRAACLFAMYKQIGACNQHLSWAEDTRRQILTMCQFDQTPLPILTPDLRLKKMDNYLRTSGEEIIDYILDLSINFQVSLD